LKKLKPKKKKEKRKEKKRKKRKKKIKDQLHGEMEVKQTLISGLKH